MLKYYTLLYLKNNYYYTLLYFIISKFCQFFIFIFLSVRFIYLPIDLTDSYVCSYSNKAQNNIAWQLNWSYFFAYNISQFIKYKWIFS